MKPALHNTILVGTFVVMIYSAVGWAQSAQGVNESGIRIGIISLQTSGVDSNEAQRCREILAEGLEELGMYRVFDRESIEQQLLKIKVSFPAHCRDPRCMIDIGRTVGLNRIIYGKLDRFDSRYGITLEMIDVNTRKRIEEVRIQSSADASVEGLIRAAIYKLHGYKEKELDISVDHYYGPQFDQKKRMYLVTGGVMTTGLLWGALSGSLLNETGKAWAGQPDAASLSAINTNSDRIPSCGRPGGMANAYLAVADDAYGIFHNPAGAAWIRNREFAISYQMRYSLIQTTMAAFVDKASREIGYGGGLLYVGTGKMQELYFVSSFAYKLYDLIPGIGPFSVGAALKCASKTTPQDAEYLSMQTAKAFGAGVDIGLLWQISDKIRYGCVLEDALYIDKWNNTQRDIHYAESQPVVLSMGGAYRAGYATLLVANGKIPLLDGQKWQMAGGLEREFFRFVKVRAGMEKYIQTRTGEPWKVTAGLGIEVPLMWGKYTHVDASYEFNTSTKALNVLNISVRSGF